MKQSSYGNNSFLKTDETVAWTREEWRVRQLTMREEEIHRFKMEGNWAAVMETLQTMLDLQSEVMHEKAPAGSNEDNKVGIKTNRYQTQNNKLSIIRQKWFNLNMRSNDPAKRRNQQEDYYQLVEDIRDFIKETYQNNVELGLSYQKKNDPGKAAYN